MLDAGMYKQLSDKEYIDYIADHDFTDLELCALFYEYKHIPEFRVAFNKEYEKRNGRSFDDASKLRILDLIKDDHIASAILYDKDIDKACNLRDEYDKLGIKP